ncbi:MAG: hypothetical protein J6Q65_05640, partial [Lentisphaeria bacterium]|nr:hypothetical protein [Lentisphaeria bacterium]
FEMEIPAGTIHELDPANMKELHVKLRLTDNDSGRVYGHTMKWEKMSPVRKDVSATDAHNGSLNVIIPKVIVKDKVPLRIEFSGNGDIDQLTIVLAGKTILPGETFRKEGDLYVLSKEVDLSDVPDGDTTCHVKIGSTCEKTYPTVCLGNMAKTVPADTLDRLEKANLPELAQRDPFKASVYFSIVSALEWFKWGMEQKKPHAIRRTAEEIKARFAAIEGGNLPETGIYSLLNLTRDPEAQLVVEFFRERKELYPYPGAIALHFGSMNLVNALFYEYKTAEEAQAFLAGLKKEKHLRIRGTAEDPEYDIPQVIIEPDKTELVSPVTGTLYFAKGNLVFQIPYVNRDAADRLATIIRRGKPATLEDREAIRKLIIQTTKRTPRKLSLPEGIEVFCGDNHSHTFLSDGRPTPLTVTAEALYIGLDYHILTDHGVFETAYTYRNNTVNKFNLNYPVGIGVEINSRWGHMNVYPVPPEGGYTFGPTFEKMLDAAHSIKGAIIQWNHPDTEYSRLPEYLENG